MSGRPSGARIRCRRNADRARPDGRCGSRARGRIILTIDGRVPDGHHDPCHWSSSGKSTLTLETPQGAGPPPAAPATPPAHTTPSWAWIRSIRSSSSTSRPSGEQSNPATYTGAFGPIRDWFAGLPGSRPAATSPVASHSTSRAGVRPAGRWSDQDRDALSPRHLRRVRRL